MGFCNREMKIDNSQKFLITVAIMAVVISAIVGTSFGYLGAAMANRGIGALLPSNLMAAQNQNSIPDYESKVIQVVKGATPAVVSIVATKNLSVAQKQGIYNPFQDFCNDPFFRQFFGDQCGAPQQQQPQATPKTQKTQVTAGSGFIIAANGLILTNRHVVDVAGADYTVVTNDGKNFKARVLAQDPVQDLAILKIDAPVSLAYLPLGDSDGVQLGQTVIAIGNALGQFSNSVSKGVISGLSRSITASDGGGSSEQLERVIQTDVAINPGNSGGPLLNLSGEVIGVNTAIAQGAQNIGFALPINQAKRDVNQIKTIGKISYPFLGIRYQLIDADLKQQDKLSYDFGALVSRGENSGDAAVASGSPAAKAGIKEGDIILEVNGQKIDKNNDLAQLIQKFNVGETVTLKVFSDGKEKEVKITLAERE